MSTIGRTHGALLRLYEIKRWSMVEMRREQNVAEHTFAVMIIAEQIWDLLFPTSHNADDRRLMQKWAMYHDAEEYFTSDLHSPLKRMLRQGSEIVLDDVINSMCTKALPGYMEAKRSIEGRMGKVVVKLADCVETLAFFNEYHVPSVANRIVETDLIIGYNKALDDVIKHQMSPLAGNAAMTSRLVDLMTDLLMQNLSFVPNLMRVRHGYTYDLNSQEGA